MRRYSLEIDVIGDLTDVPDLVGEKQPDLVLLNDGDLTYAKIRLDERSLATAVDSIDKVDDSLARALLWGAAWDMTRDAEMSARDFVALVLRGIAAETDLTAVSRFAVVRAHRGRTTTPTPPPGPSSGRPGSGASASCCWPPSPAATTSCRSPGRTPRAAHSDEALDLLAGLLDGTETLDGPDRRRRPALDVAHRAWPGSGRADEARIEEELARDNTISGQEHAAMALTVRPTAEAKAQAWRDAIERDDVANETMRQIAYAFFRPPVRRSCSRRTSRSTSRWPRRCGTRRAPSVPRRCWSTCSRSR